ncbi:MAG: aminoacyl-tRNA hydrolase [Gemmatimonadetes bacterium]|nr:MAG: aminoacyl-tRNA hydrolase [Gemmatimonadota bacterium]
MAKEGVLEVSEGLAIPRAELEVRASRAGGAGGQHVNTSSTRIELLWNVLRTTALDDERKTLVAARLVTRIDREGWLRVVSSTRRSQQQNREAAEARLVELVRGALVVRKRRRPTKPTRASREERIRDKRKRSETKRMRRGDAE